MTATFTPRRHRSSVAAKPTIVCLVALVLALLGSIGSPTKAQAATPAKLLLVLDSSGSMAEKGADGKTRMDAAKAALGAVVDSLDAKANVGLRVYGAKVFDKSAGNACADSQLVVPIGPPNKAAMKQAIAGFKPYGETPISYSLQQAGKDVGTTGQRSIVLISDGEETCNTNPCVAAQALANQGIEVRIDVVGFNVSGKAKNDLQCVAKVGRGQYSDVKDTKELTERLKQAQQRASEPFEINGTPVTGSADEKDPTPITAAAYVDFMPGKGQAKYYKLERTMARSTMWASLTMTPVITEESGVASATMVVSVIGDYINCSVGSADAFALGAKSAGLMTGRVSSAGRNLDDAKACAEKDVMLKIEASRSFQDLSKQKFQLNIFEERPADGSKLPPPVDEGKVNWAALKATAPVKVTAGTSLAKAPLVTPGTYDLDINPGEFRVVKVTIPWGQNLQAYAKAGSMPKYEAWPKSDRFELRVLAPLGGDARTFYNSPPTSSSTITGRGADMAVGTRQVRYNNRTVNDQSTLATAMSGEFYVLISLTKQAGSPQETIPMTLTINLFGTAGGAPAYEQPTPPTTEESPSPSPSDESSSEPTSSDEPTATSSAAPTATNPPTQPEQPSSESNASGKNWPLIGGVAVMAFGLAGFTAWYAHKTRRR